MGEFAQVQKLMESARSTAGQPVKRGSMAHDHDFAVIQADTAAELRDADGLAQYVTQAEQLAVRDGHRLFLAIAQRARGVAQRLEGDLGAARQSLTTALETFEALGTRWQKGRTLFELAEIEQESSDIKKSRQYYAQALELFETMQAQPAIDRTRTALGALAWQVSRADREGAPG